MIVSTISTEPLIILQPHLIKWYIIISWSVLLKIGIIVFKVMVKVQNFIESLCSFRTTDLLATKEGVLIYYLL